jgi:hypothetical protein
MLTNPQPLQKEFFSEPCINVFVNCLLVWEHGCL